MQQTVVIKDIKIVPDLQGFYIYVWHRKDDTLYVGSTINVKQRFKQHIFIRDNFQPGDMIYLFNINRVKLPHYNKDIMMEVEKELIKVTAPLYNTTHNHNDIYRYCPEWPVIPQRNYFSVIDRIIVTGYINAIKNVENRLDDYIDDRNNLNKIRFSPHSSVLSVIFQNNTDAIVFKQLVTTWFQLYDIPCLVTIKDNKVNMRRK